MQDEVEWMICHSDHKYRLLRLLLVICQFSESEGWESVIASAFISFHVSMFRGSSERSKKR